MGNALKLTAPTAELPNGLLIGSGYDRIRQIPYFAHRGPEGLNRQGFFEIQAVRRRCPPFTG
jgi:hypothetical protein